MGFMQGTPIWDLLFSFFFQAVISPTGKKWGFGIRQLIICLLFPVSQILIERLRPALYQNFFLFNIAFLVIVPCILYEIDRSYRINVKKNFMMGLLADMLIWEMSMSACIFLSMRGAGSLYTYQSYDDQQRTQIQEIKAYDGGIYVSIR